MAKIIILLGLGLFTYGITSYSPSSRSAFGGTIAGKFSDDTRNELALGVMLIAGGSLFFKELNKK